MDRFQVDIMAINETWLRAGEEGRAPSVPGYRLRHVPRADSVRGGRGGGVGFYIRQGINVRACAVPGHESVEQMWISLTVSSFRIAIGTVYRPPWFDVDLFLDIVTESVQSLSNYDYTIILGDFNINLLKLDDSKTKKLISFFDHVQLTQMVSSPTHFTDNSESLIDIICTDIRAVNVTVTPIPTLSSHAFLECVLNLKKKKIPPTLITYRPLQNISSELFQVHLDMIPWAFLSSMDNVNIMVPSLNDFLKVLFDVHAPKRTRLVKDRHEPWITYNVKYMMKLRDEAHKKWRVMKTERNKDNYLQFKKLVLEALDREKSAYFTFNINNKIKYPKVLWGNLKSSVLPRKTFNLPAHLCQPDEINRHFLDIPGNNHVNISQLTLYEFDRCTSATLTLGMASEAEIYKIIKNLHSNAEGVDEMTLDMVLMTLPQSLVVITSIVNTSIETSTFPDAWKRAVIRPIPKTDNPVSVKDLRPISILPCASKVLEKVVHLQVSKYLERNNLLPEMQSGFRPGRGTVTALLDVTDNILTAQDQRMCTILVLLDFSRAFDSINIPLLLSKLSFYGFDISSVNWFDSYLSNRTQCVEITKDNGKKCSSSVAKVARGVPQGSILGPLLFVLYSADIVQNIKNCKYHLYADDLQVYYSFASHEYQIAVQKINEDLQRIAEWSDNNSLVLNPNKSKFLIFGSRAQLYKINFQSANVCLKGDSLQRVYEARNLGLLIDVDLRFEKYVSMLVRNCFYRLKILYKIRKYISQEVRIRLVESLVLSKLSYADVVYGPRLLVRTSKLIQRVQNACARYCFCIPPRAYVTPFLNKYGLLKMRLRRKLHLASLLFGVFKNGTPLYIYDKLGRVYEGKEHFRRVRKILSVPRHCSAAFRGSFKYAATRCWNNIPPPIRDSNKKNTFVIKLKKFLLSKQVDFENIAVELSFI